MSSFLIFFIKAKDLSQEELDEMEGQFYKYFDLNSLKQYDISLIIENSIQLETEATQQ